MLAEVGARGRQTRQLDDGEPPVAARTEQVLYAEAMSQRPRLSGVARAPARPERGLSRDRSLSARSMQVQRPKECFPWSCCPGRSRSCVESQELGYFPCS